jgi:hypothetical protein
MAHSAAMKNFERSIDAVDEDRAIELIGSGALPTFEEGWTRDVFGALFEQEMHAAALAMLAAGLAGPHGRSDAFELLAAEADAGLLAKFAQGASAGELQVAVEAALGYVDPDGAGDLVDGIGDFLEAARALLLAAAEREALEAIAAQGRGLASRSSI